MEQGPQFDPSYRMRHRPANPEYGAPLHDPEMMFPGVHENPQWYKTGTGYDKESIDVIRATKGKPNASVNVYRAVPKHVDTINPGDWVTTSRSYAHQHGESNVGGKYRVLRSRVKASELHTEGNSIHEWGWHPHD